MPAVVPTNRVCSDFLAGFSQQIVEMVEDLDGMDA